MARRHNPRELLVGNHNDYEETRQLSIFVWPLLDNTRFKLKGTKCCGCIPMWMVVWAVPFFVAASGFLLQNFQLRIGTYHYVHKMLQYDLVRAKTMEPPNYTYSIPLTIGETPQNVSYGSLDDPVTNALGPYQEVKISFLDMLAALFPFFFVVFAIAMDKPFVLSRIMLCFFVLAVGKGFFAWITVIPDSNGWQACKARLAPGYSVEWYAQERSVLELLLMDPRSRLCADMMWSGHTYFVTIFAFGLHEVVRLSMRGKSAVHRVTAESVVATLAILQQTIEIYFVLKSRFHYTSDVVMAIFVTYLLYTNSLIAVVAAWWTCPGASKGDELGLGGRGKKAFWGGNNSKWLRNGLGSEGSISLGCCCCASSRQWIYSQDDLESVMTDIEEATAKLHPDDPLKFDGDTRALLSDGMHMLQEQSICGGPELDEDDAEYEYEDE